MAYSSVSQWRLAQQAAGRSHHPALGRPVGLSPSPVGPGWASRAFTPTAQLRAFSPNASAKVIRGCLTAPSDMYSISEKDIEALIEAAKREALASVSSHTASECSGSAGANPAPAGPSGTVVPSAWDLRKAFFTASTFRPDLAWPLTLAAPDWPDYRMPRDNLQREPAPLHQLDDALWKELVTVTLEVALDPKQTEALFVKIATAAGGVDGPRAVPTVLPANAKRTLAELSHSHCLNWLFLWQVIALNADFAIALNPPASVDPPPGPTVVVSRAGPVPLVSSSSSSSSAGATAGRRAGSTGVNGGSCATTGNGASGGQAASAAEMTIDLRSELQQIVSGVSNLAALHSSVAASSEANAKYRDRKIRLALHAEGSPYWTNDDDDPPSLFDLLPLVSRHLNGREFDKANFYKLLNFAPGWDLVWFDPAAAKDFLSLLQALKVLSKVLLDITSEAFRALVSDFREWVRENERCGWTPTEAYSYCKAALSYWVADVVSWFGSGRAAPLLLPDGSYESKLSLQFRTLPQINTPWSVQGARDLAKQMRHFAARDAAQEVWALAEKAGVRHPSRYSRWDLAHPVPRGGGREAPGEQPGGADGSATSSRSGLGGHSGLDIGKLRAAFGGDVCALFAEGKCRWEHCKFKHVKVLSEDELLQYRRAPGTVASTPKPAGP